MRCGWCGSFKVDDDGQCVECEQSAEGPMKPKPVHRYKFYYYLIHFYKRIVIDRKDTPELIGISWTAKGGKHADGAKLIVRKSIGETPIGEMLVGYTFDGLMQELDMEEAVRTGIPMDQWGS